MSNILRVLAALFWTGWETHGLWMGIATMVAVAGAAGGGGVISFMLAYPDWPLVAQIMASLGVAALFMIFVNRMLLRQRQEFDSGRSISATADRGGHVQSLSHSPVSGDVVGRDKTIHHHYAPGKQLDGRTVLTRLVGEVSACLDRSGPVDLTYADMAYVHDWYDGLSQAFKSALAEWRMRLKGRGLNNRRYWDTYIVPAGNNLLSEAREILNEPPITLI